MHRIVESTRLGCWLSIMLNRPDHLNAINRAVAQEGLRILVNNIPSMDFQKEFVLASGAGRAVAAGGDVHGMIEAIMSGRPEDSEFYLRCEYQFYYLMNTLPVKSLTLMPKIVMGGGLGFCHDTTIRIATENTRMAMPETKIGLFPDVGSGYFLNKIKIPGAKRWLGLTSRHIWGEETVQLGLATHLVPESRYEQFVAKLKSNNFTDFSMIEELVNDFALQKEAFGEMSESKRQNMEYYENDKFEEIYENLKMNGVEEEVKLLESVSPVGIAVANRHLIETEGKSLADVLKIEFRAMRYQQR